MTPPSKHLTVSEAFLTIMGSILLLTVIAMPATLIAFVTGFGFWMFFAPVFNYCNPFLFVNPLIILYTLAGFILVVKEEMYS